MYTVRYAFIFFSDSCQTSVAENQLIDFLSNVNFVSPSFVPGLHNLNSIEPRRSQLPWVFWKLKTNWNVCVSCRNAEARSLCTAHIPQGMTSIKFKWFAGIQRTALFNMLMFSLDWLELINKPTAAENWKVAELSVLELSYLLQSHLSMRSLIPSSEVHRGWVRDSSNSINLFRAIVELNFCLRLW